MNRFYPLLVWDKRQLGELAISLPVTPPTAFHCFQLQKGQDKSNKCAEGGQWDGVLRWKAVRSECPQRYRQMRKEGEITSFIFSISSWICDPKAHKTPP